MIDDEKLEEVGMAKIKDYKPLSSPGEFASFIQTNVHADFIKEAELRIEDMRDVLEEVASQKFHQTQGGIKAIRLMMTIFVDLLHNAEEDQSMPEENEDA